MIRKQVAVRAYSEGAAYYLAGLGVDENPYPYWKQKQQRKLRTCPRYLWFMGWYDAWRVGKYGAVPCNRFQYSPIQSQ